jgi:hypothetical protein
VLAFLLVGVLFGYLGNMVRRLFLPCQGTAELVLSERQGDAATLMPWPMPRLRRQTSGRSCWPLMPPGFRRVLLPAAAEPDLPERYPCPASCRRMPRSMELFYSMIDPEHRRSGKPSAAQSRARSTTSNTCTVAPDGRSRWIRAKGRVYRDGGHQPTRFDGITIDIQQQKEAEAAFAGGQPAEG